VSKGLRDGKGVFVASKGTPKYDGEWVLGKRQGHGTLWYDNEGKCYYEVGGRGTVPEPSSHVT